MAHKVLPEEVWGGLLPKRETQSLDFVENNPSWDGRGIVVGILDTGVDPGAVGLEKTTEGKPKVIDIIDCTGSGDVIMHGPHKVDSEGFLPGIGGQRIKVNPNWTNPTGDFRVGIKRLYELYPKPLKERIKQKRQKSWSREHEQAEMLLQRAGPEMSAEEKTARLALLRSMGSESVDSGPIIDCVTFHDGEHWQAVVDCSGTGDMSCVEPMTNFGVRQQYRRFSEEDAFNFGVNIFDEGTVLSIVTDTGAHGTHVAGIVSAYHPDNPECNGVAPGAQIISLKIGNTHLGSMETGVGLLRALIEAINRGCNIINMSYGEASAWDNEGAFVKLAEELVYKHGITFVSSAGNNGPCLSTVGAPGGTSSCMISVGAFVTQSLMRAAYSMLGTVPETNFTWSSVGPSTDGDMGVSVLAPGGAITCVPNWTLNKSQLMNGTSMSSPNACGCMALLLSAAKQNFSESALARLTPARLRLAVENSAQLQNTDLVDVLGQHYGLLQVERAWDHILSNSADASIDIPLKVTVNSQRFKRGIYLRHASEMKASETFQVNVTPLFHEDETSDIQIHYEMRVQVKATASWVQCPDYLLVARAGKMMRVTVDPTQLQPGKHYVEFVRGYDENNLDKGPVFELPITVVAPEVFPPFTQQHRLGIMTLPQTQRIRKFISPPPGCTYIDVHIADQRLNDAEQQSEAMAESGSSSSSSDASSQMIVLHALQLMPGQPYRDNEKQVYMNLTPGSTHCASFAVTAGVTLELVLTRFWSTLGDVNCDVTVHFKGVTPSVPSLCMTSGEQISEIVTVTAELSTVTVAPTGKLDKWLSTVNPSSPGKVTALGERDVLPSGTPLYQMILEYTFDQAASGSVTPRLKAFNGILYESPFHSQFYHVYNTRKVIMACGDAFPESHKLDKGQYTVRIQIRHESSTVLEEFANMTLVLERSLEAASKLTCHRNLADASLGTPLSAMPIYRGTSQSLFWKGPSKLPKGVKVGDVLTGSVSYLKKAANGFGAGTRPGGFPVRYLISSVPSPATPSKGTADSPALPSPSSSSVPAAEDNAVAKKFADSVRAAKIKFVESIAGDASDFDAIYDSVLSEYPDYVPLRLAKLNHLIKCNKQASSSDATPTSLGDAIISCADVIIALLNEKAIAEELGTNVDMSNAEAVKVRKEVESDRDALVTALAAKASILVDKINEFERSASVAVATEEVKGEGHDASEVDAIATAFSDTYSQLQKWSDTSTSDKQWRLYVTKLRREKKFGAALKRVNEMIAKKRQANGSAANNECEMKELYKEQSVLLEELGWAHITRNLSLEEKLSSVDEYLPF